MNWKHNQLLDDLSEHLGIFYKNIPLGSVWAAQYQRQYITDPTQIVRTQIADALRVRPSYTRFCIDLYEVKVSRADFLSDIRTEKWRGYLDHSHRIYFAAPSGLVAKDEIPEEAGLIVRGKRGWAVTKKALPREPNLSTEMFMSLIFYRQKAKRRNAQISQQRYMYADRAKKFGKDKAFKLARYDKYEKEIREIAILRGEAPTKEADK